MTVPPQRTLEIAIIGTRGVPARYGGFETFAEELGARMVERGHRVTVYGRRGFGEAPVAEHEYRGITCRTLPTFRHKYLETPFHALVCFIDLWRRKFDAAIVCNAANAPFAWVARLRGVPLAVNVDGIERKRKKWSWVGRLWYRLGEFSAVLFANKVIADAQVIAAYYQATYGCGARVIEYGAEARRREPGETLGRFGLKSRHFILYVSRLEPENNALGVVAAYSKLGTDIPLVIVGDAPYAAEYKDRVRAAAGPNVVFTGFQFGEPYYELQSNALLYVQATEVGGTHPALLEAMAYGNCVVANQTPEHEEVLADCGVYYPKNDFEALARKLSELLAQPELISRLGKRAEQRAADMYSWSRIVDAYEQLCAELSGG